MHTPHTGHTMHPKHAMQCTPHHARHATPRHAPPRRAAPHHTTPHHTTPHHTTPHHTTPHHTTPHHTTPHHTTPHHTLSTPQLYSRAGCRVRSPRRQGPGTANRQCTNSVGCVHVPVPSTIPRDPAAPSTGRPGPGNGQRPLARTAGQASPSSPPNTPAHTRGPQQSPVMRPPPAPLPLPPPPPPPRRRSRSQPPPLPRNLPLSLPYPPLTGWQRPGGAPPGPRIGGWPRGCRASETRWDRNGCDRCVRG